MLRNLLTLLLLASVVFGAAAQDTACSVLAVQAISDDGGVHLMTYRPGDDGYIFASRLFEPQAQTLTRSHLSNQHVRAALDMSDTAPGTRLDLYRLYTAGLFRFKQVMQENLLPRPDGWSYQGRYLALHDINQPSGNQKLVVYDADTESFLEPTPLTEVSAVHWSPAGDMLALVGAGAAADAPLKVQIVSPDAELVFETAVEATTVERIVWLTGTRLAVIACDTTACQASLVDVTTGLLESVDFGDYVPEAYLAWRDSYIVSRRADNAVGIWNEVDGFRLYTGLNRVTSRPTVTSDGRHISVRIVNDGQPAVLIGDLFDSKLWYTLRLHGTPADAPFSARFGDWNVDEQKFLYTDAGTTYVYDALANKTVAVIEDANTAQWICPERQ